MAPSTDHEVVVRASRLKAALLIPVCAAIAATGLYVVWLMLTEDGPVVARLAYGALFGSAALLFGFGVPRLLRDIVSPRVVIAIAPHGISVPPYHSIPWSAITDVSVVRRSRTKFIETQLSADFVSDWVNRDPTALRRLRARLLRAGSKNSLVIPSSKLPLRLRTKRLAELVKQRWAASGHRHGG